MGKVVEIKERETKNTTTQQVSETRKNRRIEEGREKKKSGKKNSKIEYETRKKEQNQITTNLQQYKYETKNGNKAEKKNGKKMQERKKKWL